MKVVLNTITLFLIRLFSNLLTLSIPDEGYFRNALCTPIYNYGLLRRWTSRIVNLWGLFSQVDNSGCPPTKMAIIVLLTEQWTKSDTYMTTDTKIDNWQKVIPIYDKTLKLTMDKKWYPYMTRPWNWQGTKVIRIFDKTLKLTMDKKWYSLRSIYCTWFRRTFCSRHPFQRRFLLFLPLS